MYTDSTSMKMPEPRDVPFRGTRTIAAVEGEDSSDPREIPREILLLTDRIDTLGSYLSDLRVRLGGVLSDKPRPGNDLPSLKATCLGTILGQRLNEQRIRVEEMSEEILAIMNILEL